MSSNTEGYVFASFTIYLRRYHFAYTIVLFINSNEKSVNFDMIIFQNAKLKFRDIIFYLSFR